MIYDKQKNHLLPPKKLLGRIYFVQCFSLYITVNLYKQITNQKKSKEREICKKEEKNDLEKLSAINYKIQDE